ncbi:MAG: hypothetical protein LUH46_06015 [Alistipes sp.]|nr:hypothetical protein [Alistipes sp.]
MKRALLYIGIFFSAVSCGRNDYSLQSGDLLFQAGESSDMTGAITAATGENGRLNFSHVGIAVVKNGADSVLEATTNGGVRLTALPEFLARSTKIGGHPAVVAMRLKDTTGVCEAIVRARSYLGLPYDYSFLPDNGKFYCSELVWECYRKLDGSPLFTARPMNFRTEDGTLPPFWAELFARQGESVPEGVPGTNPNDMSQERALREVYRWF